MVCRLVLFLHECSFAGDLAFGVFIVSWDAYSLPFACSYVSELVFLLKLFCYIICRCARWCVASTDTRGIADASYTYTWLLGVLLVIVLFHVRNICFCYLFT